MSAERQTGGGRVAQVLQSCLAFVIIVIVMVVFLTFELLDTCQRAFNLEQRVTDRLLAAAQYEETGSPD